MLDIEVDAEDLPRDDDDHNSVPMPPTILQDALLGVGNDSQDHDDVMVPLDDDGDEDDEDDEDDDDADDDGDDVDDDDDTADEEEDEDDVGSISVAELTMDSSRVML